MSRDAGVVARAAPSYRDPRPWIAAAALVAALFVLAPLSIALGAVHIPFARVVEIATRFDDGSATGFRQDALIVLDIRLPRLLLGCLVGAALGLSGTLMQGLFRNPLADPGLIGVSAGAGLAAAIAIVLGDRLTMAVGRSFAPALLPGAAFAGALCATSALYAFATRRGRTSIATMLLAGVALAALAGSLTGLLAFISDDRQLRDLTFWSLGSLGGASWSKVAWLAPPIVLLAAASPFLARGLNALALGEAEAFYLGVNVQRLKLTIVFLVATAVGASVAAAGVVSFVGIVGPQLLRLAIGPNNRALLPLSALAGAALLVGADIVARTLAAPAEVPIGILTAAIGAPFLLSLLATSDGGFSP